MDTNRGERLKAALAQADRGEQSAFAEIVTERQAMVFSITWHYLQDWSLAEDVAQDVFLDLLRLLRSLTPGQKNRGIRDFRSS